MPILRTDECQSYLVEEIHAKVEDERGYMSFISFELVGLNSMCLKEILRININSCGSLS